MTDMDFHDWRIYLIGPGVGLVGKQVGGVLSPVFELRSQAVPQQGGRMAIARSVWPVLLCSVQRVTAPTGAASLAVQDLPASVQREIAQGIEGASKLVQEMRAAESGITIAKEVPK